MKKGKRGSLSLSDGFQENATALPRDPLRPVGRNALKQELFNLKIRNGHYAPASFGSQKAANTSNAQSATQAN